MRNLFLAPLLLTSTIALLACSDSTKTTSGSAGTGGSGGSGSASTGTGGTSGSGSPTATSAGGGCSDDNSCGALFACGCCIDLLCAPECETLRAACAADSECNMYADCAAFCFDQPCVDSCATTYPGGVTKAEAFLSCIYCAMPCETACTDHRTWGGLSCP